MSRVFSVNSEQLVPWVDSLYEPGVWLKKVFFGNFFVDIVCKYVKISVCLSVGKHKPPVGEDDISVCMS